MTQTRHSIYCEAEENKRAMKSIQFTTHYSCFTTYIWNIWMFNIHVEIQKQTFNEINYMRLSIYILHFHSFELVKAQTMGIYVSPSKLIDITKL